MTIPADVEPMVFERHDDGSVSVQAWLDRTVMSTHFLVADPPIIGTIVTIRTSDQTRQYLVTGVSDYGTTVMLELIEAGA